MRPISPIPFTRSRLLTSSLRHYWRAHLALMFAAAIGVAVLTGSLLIGSSVRGSLRDHALSRLGNVDQALIATDFFRAILANVVPQSAPLIMMPASAAHAETGARASQVQAFGVNQKFWSLISPSQSPLAEDEAIINAALAHQLQAKTGDEVLIRIQKPSAVPRETFLGKREETISTLRLRVRRILNENGNFSLAPTQSDPLNVFIPIDTLARRIEQPGRANVILSAANRNPQFLINRAADLDDVGIKIFQRTNYLSVESSRIFLPKYTVDLTTQTAAALHATVYPTLTYLANAMRIGDRMTPYSTITALDDLNLRPNEIALNAWTADDLQAKIGNKLQLTYFLPAAGQFTETTVTLTVSQIIPTSSPLVDRGLTPDFPGIAEAETLATWNPPFPMDMKRIRPKDEDYWDEHRAAPKAFVSLATGQRLWANRYGDLTSIRVEGATSTTLHQLMREHLNSSAAGLQFQPIRRQALEASEGASDFSGLFIGFSFFLLIAAAMLIHALFQLGVQSRAREFGILSATGLPSSLIRNLMLAEGGIIAGIGGVVGLLFGLAYAGLLIHGLRTWWIDAVGAPFLKLHIDPASILIGLVGGWLIAMFAIALAARSLARQAIRGLIAGRSADEAVAHRSGRIALAISILFLLGGIALALIAPSQPVEQQSGLFFGAGASLLIASLVYCRLRLRRAPPRLNPVFLSTTLLGLLAAHRRPGRSMLVIGLMACATFIIVAVGAQRQSPPAITDKNSGTGGFSLIAESTLPIYENLQGARAWRLRLESGDDPSCLNLYKSARPRIAGVSEEFIQRSGFAFSQTIDDAKNPWLLLNRAFPDGAIPAIGDANTVMWLLHSGLGKDLLINGHRFHFVALLQGSIFQSELLISESNFIKVFPHTSGYRLFAIEAPPASVNALSARLESEYEDFGLDVASTRDRLAALLSVENTYLSIFMALGGLGLLLGTLGMALALLRNLIERRREFALLRAVGFRHAQLIWLTTSENIVLISIGMAIGTGSALIAVLPASHARSAPVPWIDLIALLAGVFFFGAVAIVAGTAIALRSQAIKVLKEE